MARDVSKIILALYTAWLVFFIYAPIITMVIFSFNSSPRTVPPFDGPSLRWFDVLFSQKAVLLEAFTRSITLAIVTMLIATPLFTVAGLAYKRRFKGDEFFFFLVTIGIIMPGITFSLGALVFYNTLGIKISLWTGLPVHLIWAIPWGLILVRVMIDPNIIYYEEAARTLGASGWQVFRRITLPLFVPAILGGALFAFTLSFTELIRSIFVVSPNTLPLQVLAEVTVWGISPYIFAIGSMIVLISLALLFVASFVLRGVFEKLQV
ncbi:MAG: ABC transporter permease [Candidatus Caldarchaeum sp.]|nr:ABC transporter permease [Candidatus Caldarchaeum sp.]